MTASVFFRGASANFHIRSDSAGIYYAKLVSYEGDAAQSPPNEITIMRGIRQWTGSYNEDFLLFRLGKIIEERLRTTYSDEEKDRKG